MQHNDNTRHQVVNFGCRVNTAEQHEIGQLLARSDLAAHEVVVVNSCAVTQESERQLRQRLRKLRTENAAAKIVLTGCAAQLRPQAYAALDTVDLVIGNREKLSQATYRRANVLNAPAGTTQVGDIMADNQVERALLPAFGARARAFVQIQTGCDHRCTFCTIPFARGNSRSFTRDRITEQVRKFADAGYSEVVLSGVDIASWGRDLDGGTARLGDLITHVLDNVTQLPRLRLSTLDCIDVDDAFIAAIATQPRLMPHIHMSLQSADAMILKRMARRHSPQAAAALIARLRAARPDIVFGADIIVGFPTETPAMFENSCRFVRDNRIHCLHVFPYSPRPGTPAARIDASRQVPRAERLARARHLRALGQDLQQRFLQTRIATPSDVLIEAENCGKDPYYTKVRIDHDTPLRAGDICPVWITGHDAGVLLARARV